MIPKKPTDSIWTDEQWQAIYEEGKNIIVSAGAGSGKTAVLTERVIRKLKDGIPVNKLLILTFTKAAAEEMKDRIRKKIKKEPSLKENLNLLDSSYITTFDSFSLSIVKKYHYLLNISPNISIIDASIINIKKNEVMDELFLEYYEKKDPDFLNLISNFCTKDDTELRNYFLNISNKLDLLSDQEQYLNNYLKENFNNTKIEKDIDNYTELIREKVENISNIIKETSYLDQDFSYKLKESLTLLEEFKDYDDLTTRLNIKLPSSPKGSIDEIKNNRKEISETIKEIKVLARFKNKEEIKENIKRTYPIIKIMITILKEFKQKITNYKKQNNTYEFNDIAILAIKVVKENKNVKEELKELFQEIMIDEYQDTNDLQEEFITMISENNTYMVGDIKQSIYRFRNANPYIFKNKYDTYSQNIQGGKIDLNKNFRSREEVINNINLIFNLIMNEEIGGADYFKDHQMVFENKKYLEQKPSHNNDLEIWNYEYNKNNLYTKEEIESFMIAKDIKEKIQNHHQVFDKETSTLRDARYEDFAIIMDRSSSFDLYKKIFNYFSIPITLLKDEKMNEETDILVVSNLIRLLLKIKKRTIDTEFKYLFTSIQRSFLYETEDTLIFETLKNNQYKGTKLYQTCEKIIQNLDYISIHQLIDTLIEEFNIYEKYITLGNIQSGIVKINQLRETAINLEELGYTIEDFSNYLKELLTNDYKIEYKVPISSSSSVKVMTIHKSKGLEYPICYFSGLYKQFNISDLKEKFLIDKKIGIMAPYFDEGIEETIYKELLKRNYIEEEISEKIRLFYVALTRAREKIILITPTEEDNNITSLNKKEELSYRSFSDILNSIKFRTKEKYITKNIEDLNLTKEYNYIKNIAYQDKIESIKDNFDVKEINIEKKEITTKTYSKKTNKLITKQEKENMNFGTKIHEYLEYLDLKHPNTEYIDNEYCKQKINAFLNQPLLKNIKEATIYQEHEFIFEKNKEKYHGIIDLMLEYENHIDIIDYKLKNIEDTNYQKQLIGYQDYIKTLTNKKINLYLYSLIEEKIKEI